MLVALRYFKDSRTPPAPLEDAAQDGCGDPEKIGFAVRRSWKCFCRMIRGVGSPGQVVERSAGGEQRAL